MNKFICSLLFLLVSRIAFSQSPNHLLQFPITEGSIHSITAGGSYTVLQGNFNSIGSYQGNGVVIDVATGTYDPAWPKFHGYVYTAISDNNGGWFVAGTSNVNSTTYQRLVHVKSDKTIDETWSPTPNNFVTAFAIEGNTLYVGGAFTQIAGSARNRLAAFDITTGNLLPWNPNVPSGRIETLTVSGGTVYVGGQFTEVGGQPRKNIAAINGTTGSVTSWNPTVDGINSSVQTIKVSGGLVYVGGFFTSAGGQSRRSIAALDITTGTATAWNPNPNNSVVTTIEMNGSTLFMGGTFTTVGGISREYLAEVDLVTGALTSWDPNFDDATVYDLELSGTTLYVAGTFQTVNGIDKEGLAAVSTVTGALLSWDAYPGEGITSMVLAGDLMFVVASDNQPLKFGWKPTNNFAVVDNETGELYLTDLDVGGETIISALVRNGMVYLAGTFTEVNGQPRLGLAAVDILTGVVQSWAPETDGYVADMASFAGRIFLGGDFSSVNGSPTEALAIVDAVTGNLEPLSFDFEGGRITALDYSNGNIYAAGNFLIVNGTNRENIVGIDAADGSILSWHPSDPAIETMNKLEADGDWIVLRNESNEVIVLESFDDDIYMTFQDMEDFALFENLLILGTTTIDFGVNGLAAYDLLADDFTSWIPDVGSDPDGYPSVSVVGVNEDLIFIAGSFRSLGFEAREGFGAYNIFSVNQPPVIETTTSSVAIGGVATINLLDLISDPNNNLDLSSLQVIDGVSQAGAFATINAAHELILDYQGVAFNGTDVVTIEACDFDLACTQEQITIEVIGKVVVYNALSPNSDLKNEIFYLQHIDLLPDTQNNHVTIYNRWGDVVFEISNYNNADRVFNGKNKNGNDLSSGTYFYKIKFASGRPGQTGYLSLKR